MTRPETPSARVPHAARRRVLRQALIAGAAFVASSGLVACGSESTGPPNVILISIDTMRADYLGCYDPAREASPEIDALASAGVVFEDVTSASPWTLPSHASMLTGQYPSTHGVKDHGIELTSATLATHLGDAGYQTMSIVNSHNIGFPDYGLMRGYDRKRWEFEMNVVDDQPGDDILNKGPIITAMAIEWLNERDKERPFFFFLHYYDVHTDFTPAVEHANRFVSPYQGELTGKTKQLVKARNRMETIDEDDVRWLEEMYEAEIHTFDDVIARLFDYLDDEGLAERTVVAITSDHGEEYAEHGGLLHGRTHYQEVVGIPFILRGPGVPAGARYDMPVHLVDVAPTLYGLAGVAPPPDLDGIDLTALWRAPDTLPEVRFLFSEADHNNIIDDVTQNDIRAMVRIGNDKLVYDKVTGEKELFDLAADPLEQVNRAAEDPDRLAFLWEKLEEFMAHGNVRDAAEMSAEARANLDALGYLETSVLEEEE